MKFSITKTQKDTSLPVAVQPDIVLIYADDILKMPEADERKVCAISEIQLKPITVPYSLYLTSTEQVANATTEGETETRGWVHQITGTFPGTGLYIAEWIVANINQGFVAFRRHCNGTYKIFGSKYNPLFFTGNIIEDQETSVCQIEFQQTKKSKVPYLYYSVGELFPLDPNGKMVLVLADETGKPIVFSNNQLIEV